MPVPGSSSTRPGEYRSATEADETQLNRAITPKLLLLFIVGDILGGGIYALVGEVGGEVGGAIWAPFMLALVMAFITAASYAELVSKYPRAGGAALYVKKAFGNRFLAFMVAFAVMASGVTSAATLTTGFGSDYLKVFVDIEVVLAALGALLLISLVNLRGISESVKLNVGFTLVEITGLILIIVICAVAVLNGEAEPSRAFEFKQGDTPLGLILAGATLAFYALIGFEDSVNVAEETVDPRRTFPRTIFMGVGIAGAIYLLVTIGASMVVPTNGLANSSAPLLEVVRQGPLDIPIKVFSAIGLLALVNGALINMIMASRLLYGMSEERVLPGIFGRVLPGRRTPFVAIAFTTLLCAGLIIYGNLSQLANTTVLLLVIVFIFVNTSVLVLRRRDPVEHDHFKVPVFIPPIGIGISVALLTQIQPKVYLTGAILLAIGLALFAITFAYERRFGSGPPPSASEPADGSPPPDADDGPTPEGGEGPSAKRGQGPPSSRGPGPPLPPSPPAT